MCWPLAILLALWWLLSSYELLGTHGCLTLDQFRGVRWPFGCGFVVVGSLIAMQGPFFDLSRLLEGPYPLPVCRLLVRWPFPVAWLLYGSRTLFSSALLAVGRHLTVGIVLRITYNIG